MASVFEEQRGRLCAVCYQEYTCEGDHVPRILTCGHTFCTGCLSRLLGQLLAGHIRCPTCKGATLVPSLSNDINKVPKNFAVLEILESMNEGLQAASSPPAPLCNEHNEPMKVFCIQDDQLICIYCQVHGAHQGHECQLVTVLAEETRKTIQSHVEVLDSHTATMLTARQAVKNTIAAVYAKEDKLMSDVTQHFEILRRKLGQRENKLKMFLNNRTSAKYTLLDKQKGKMHDMKFKVDELSASCQALLNCPDYELVQRKKQIETEFYNVHVNASIVFRDASPCCRDDLKCHLDHSIVKQIAKHGIFTKESPSACGGATHINAAPTHTRDDALDAASVGSGGDADRQDRAAVTDSRQSSGNSPDEDMNVESLATSSSSSTQMTSVPLPTETANPDQMDTRPTESQQETRMDEIRRDESGLWNVASSSSQQQHGRQSHHPSHYLRFRTGSLMCSVFNCSSNSSLNFFVRCKNCLRLFCQKCVTTSISARRCCKRHRGHVFLPASSTNGTAASSSRVNRHFHHHIHPSLQLQQLPTA